MYTHTVMVPKTLVFKPEYHKCRYCHQRIQKHIHCDGARWHVISWSGRQVLGRIESDRRCSEYDCEINHEHGKCKEALKKAKRQLTSV